MDDDLYQNAWTETTHTIPATLKDDPAPSWTSTKLTSSYGEEADLAAPSWSTGAGIHWNEPSSPGFSWSQTEPDLAWGASAYEGISIGKTPAKIPLSDVPEADHSVEHTPDVGAPVEEEAGFVADDVRTSAPADERIRSPSPESPGPTPELAAPPSPDGFGSFETAFTEETTQSPGFTLDTAEADPWGASAWSEPQPEQSEQSEEPVDEWERARQEKAKQDRRVPPELLAHILQQCEALGRDICPDTEKEGTEAATESWNHDWRSGMEGVPGLTALMESFLPPLTLKPPVRFPQTLVAKKLASSVKLTKNLPLTKGSPMSHYLAAKGSTAWETSVKEQKEIVEDDIPVGWRIMEKSATATSSDTANQKKPTGRLFSFWGRRQSQVSPQSTGADDMAVNGRSSSVDKPRSPLVDEVKAEAKVESRRVSQESVRSSVTSNHTPVSPSVAEPSSSQQTPVTFATTVTSTASGMSSYGSTPDPVSERSGTPPAPSAMSRFLNRFSRRSSSIGGSPRSSLALSSDDLEFLSDIVPSASDDADEDPTDALEKFVNDKRGSTVPVLPPPLAPPPKAPASKPTGISSGPPSAGSTRGAAFDDFAAWPGFADASDNAVSSSRTTATASAGQTSIPVLPPPLVPSRPITPSATPGAGPSRISNPLVPTSLTSSSRPPSRLHTLSPPSSKFALPPPPSFQRSTSPNMLAMATKPKLSSPFPLPLPPRASLDEREPSSASTTSSHTSYETAAEASPTSPTSSLPLGALYPHLVTPASPPLASAQPMLPSQSSSNGSSSPYGVATPLASTFPLGPPPLGPPTMTLAPPSQSHSAGPSSATPLTSSSLFDDDDFSDFQSPVESSLKPSPPAPSPIAKSPRTYSGSTMSAAGRSHTAAPNPSPFSFPAPPRPAGAARAASAAPATHFSAFGDDDDFADFQASPSSATALRPGTSSLASSTSSLFPTSVSDQALLTPKKQPAGFDDIGDFFASSLRTPSPPRVPSKSPASKPPISAPAPAPAAPVPSTSMPTMPSASSSSSLLSRRKPHAAEHLHTLSLVEKAAARPGQWPAPPSPLPQAIPGPFAGPAPRASQQQQQQVNLMDDEAAPLAPLPGPGLAPSFSSPAMLNPTRPASGAGMAGAANGTASSSSSLLQGWDFQAGGASQPTAPGVAKPAAVNGTQGGGLSAQDLSFFEGL